MKALMIKRVKISVLCLVLPVVAGVSSFSRFTSQAQTLKPAQALVRHDPLKEIASYRTWTRVNEKPNPARNFTIDGQDA